MHKGHNFDTLLQKKLSITVQNYYQLRFLNRCRYTTVNNLELSAAVLEPLLIYIISSGSKTAADNRYQ
jgi:hypothetical protein